jgi:hypothetical protein
LGGPGDSAVIVPNRQQAQLKHKNIITTTMSETLTPLNDGILTQMKKMTTATMMQQMALVIGRHLQ